MQYQPHRKDTACERRSEPLAGVKFLLVEDESDVAKQLLFLL